MTALITQRTTSRERTRVLTLVPTGAGKTVRSPEVEEALNFIATASKGAILDRLGPAAFLFPRKATTEEIRRVITFALTGTAPA